MIGTAGRQAVRLLTGMGDRGNENCKFTLYPIVILNSLRGSHSTLDFQNGFTYRFHICQTHLELPEIYIDIDFVREKSTFTFCKGGHLF